MKEENNTINEIIGALARGYCTDMNEYKIVDTELINAMALEVEKLIRLAEESLVRRIRDEIENMKSPYYKDGPVSIGNSEKTHNMTMGFYDCIEQSLDLPILTPKPEGD